ncbi:MAG: VWA domain-containing protein [Phycisphaerales bacterium]|nr:VWA domain-containing protein [Phycisphaerales bacterium]MCB9857953.1 VWA domain-containing protein [Phycisphaerales bacterium]
MNRTGVLRKRRIRRGSVIVQSVIFGGTVAVGVAALAVDTGLMFSAKQELQSAADAAALAAASQLGQTGDAFALATAEAQKYANANKVAGESSDVLDADVVFGHAVLNGSKFDFEPNVEPYDAVKVTVRRDQSAKDGPLSLLFAKTFGKNTADISASAVAMLVPRDISLVIDLSGSMNDDSELRHYKRFASEKSGYIDGVQINLKKIWTALPIEKGNAGVGNGIDPPPPGQPNNENDQPGTGPGSPANAGGNPDPGAEGAAGGGGGEAGPRWGWMTAWGDEITLGEYDASDDWGLYYVRKGSSTSDSDVIENLTEAGYSSAERSALLSSQYDGNTTYYRNRVKVLLGLAGWRSKKSGSKYNGGPGDGDNRVDSNELWQEVDWPFADGSWNEYIDYVASSSTQMEATDSELRYRFGLKTMTNYLLESLANKNDCPELQDAPEEPLFSAKNAVQVMIDEIIALETQDHVSLETFGQYGIHRVDLTIPEGNENLADLLQTIPSTMYGFQAGHDTSITNIGGGMDKAIDELTSDRARSAASKVIVLLTDGKPNVNSNNQSVGNNHPSALGWAQDRADAAKEMHMTVFTVGVGGDVDDDLLTNMASSPDNYYYADNAPDPDNEGQPLYINQLKQIFQTLGGKRPVRLIQ